MNQGPNPLPPSPLSPFYRGGGMGGFHYFFLARLVFTKEPLGPTNGPSQASTLCNWVMNTLVGVPNNFRVGNKEEVGFLHLREKGWILSSYLKLIKLLDIEDRMSNLLEQ